MFELQKYNFSQTFHLLLTLCLYKCSLLLQTQVLYTSEILGLQHLQVMQQRLQMVSQSLHRQILFLFLSETHELSM